MVYSEKSLARLAIAFRGVTNEWNDLREEVNKLLEHNIYDLPFRKWVHEYTYGEMEFSSIESWEFPRIDDKEHDGLVKVHSIIPAIKEKKLDILYGCTNDWEKEWRMLLPYKAIANQKKFLKGVYGSK